MENKNKTLKLIKDNATTQNLLFIAISIFAIVSLVMSIQVSNHQTAIWITAFLIAFAGVRILESRVNELKDELTKKPNPKEEGKHEFKDMEAFLKDMKSGLEEMKEGFMEKHNPTRKIEGYNGVLSNTRISVQTKEEWSLVVKKLLSVGASWNDGNNDEIHENYWEQREDTTEIVLYHGIIMFSASGEYHETDPARNFPVISTDEAIKRLNFSLKSE